MRYDGHPLAEVVEDDQLVEQHQVGILEALVVPRLQRKAGFGVFDVVVREVPYKAARERRHVLHRRRPVLCEDAADDIGRVSADGPSRTAFVDLYSSVGACQIHLRLEPDDRVPAPARPVLYALEYEAVVVHGQQGGHDLHRRADIGQYLA